MNCLSEAIRIILSVTVCCSGNLDGFKNLEIFEAAEPENRMEDPTKQESSSSSIVRFFAITFFLHYLFLISCRLLNATRVGARTFNPRSLDRKTFVHC